VISPRVVVLDYGSGNVHSAAKALAEAGANVELSSDRDAALKADGLLVPGVGAFAAVMEQLDAINAGEIIDKRLVAGKPVMGICVGLQVMFELGVEHGLETVGLGQWPGKLKCLTRRCCRTLVGTLLLLLKTQTCSLVSSTNAFISCTPMALKTGNSLLMDRWPLLKLPGLITVANLLQQLKTALSLQPSFTQRNLGRLESNF